MQTLEGVLELVRMARGPIQLPLTITGKRMQYIHNFIQVKGKSMKRNLKVLSAAFVATVASATVLADSARLTYSGNGHDYQRFDTARTWSSAQSDCAGRGGGLAVFLFNGVVADQGGHGVQHVEVVERGFPFLISAAWWTRTLCDGDGARRVPQPQIQNQGGGRSSPATPSMV